MIHTPLWLSSWSKHLRNHPNQTWVDQLLVGLQEGVRIGFNPAFTCTSASSNMQSALEHPDVVQGYLDAERDSGNLAGPYSPDTLSGIVFNRFGVIPKANKPGKWRLIVDLSYPEGQSVNDGISSADASMIYSSIDDAARLILDAGEGALLAKIDVASAFRIIPVHPDDRHLLGMLWKGQAYIDKQLPFGLRSAPMLFNGYADALEWILREHGVSRVIHYLDDFLVVGSAHSTQCAGFLSTMLQVCDDLGIPLASDKIEGPTSSLSFLGIRLDSVTMEARLPEDKLARLCSELEVWQDKKSCTRKELEHYVISWKSC